jgi:pimeloyl-ACP methyl ester carboxylesterase
MPPLSYKADDGVRIAYYDWNSDAKGPPIVLQHGFSVGALRNWFQNGIVDTITAHGRRVIALDARGHGESDKPRDPARYGGVRLAQDVMGLMHRLNVETYDLVGYSMGAMIAIHAALRDVRVRRLVLSGTGAYLLERTNGDSVFLSIEIADALAAEDPSRITDLAGAWLRKLAEDAGSDLLALSALARSPLQRLRLDALSIPTLVLVGDADLFASGAQHLANAIAGAQFALVPGDHVSTLHNVLYATSVLEFLS